jgi:hypothetical protein
VGREVRQQARADVRDKRDALHTRRNARREPRRKGAKRFNADVRDLALLERVQCSSDRIMSLSLCAGDGTEDAELVPEGLAHGRVDGVADGAEGRPNSVCAHSIVQDSSIVERERLELLERRSKLVKTGKTAAALGFDPDLDLADPAALELDALSDHFLLEAAHTS